MDDVIQINLRGTEFLSSSPFVKDLLHALVKKGSAVIRQNGQIYVDRNPFIFHHILDYYCGGEFHLPKNICPIQAQKEIEFWRIPSKDIPTCCYEVLYNENELQYTSIENLESDLKAQTNQSISPKVTGPPTKNCVGRLRYLLLEAHLHPFSTWTGRIWIFVLALNTITSIITYLLNSDRNFRIPREGLSILSGNFTTDIFLNDKELVFLRTKREPIKGALEIITNSFLILDILLKFAITHQKRKFLLNVQNSLEIATGIAAYLVFYFDANIFTIVDDVHFENFIIVVGILQGLRVIRILRLVESTPEMKILKLSLYQSWREFLLLLIVLTSFSLIFGSAIFWIEIAEPDTFPNIFVSIWWGIITMTTVGYGDFYPKSTGGYFVAIIAAVFGLMLLAMPITILASNFNSFYNCYKYRKRHLLSK